MARIAAIDVGTNSVLLLVVEQTRGGLVTVTDRAIVTRLGKGVDRTRRLSDAACERTLVALRSFEDELRSLRVGRFALVGTSALRDAIGADGFRAAVAGLFGTELLVLSGEEEAELAYRGALSGLGLAGRVVVGDIGGGSTEVIQGVVNPGNTRIEALTSLELGCVRSHERHVRHDPPAEDEIRVLRAEAKRALATLPPPGLGSTLVAVAGTATTLAAVVRGIDPYDGARVHGARLAASAVREAAVHLGELSVDDRRKVVGLEAGRADVIVAGAWILAEMVGWAGTPDLVVSDRGVRWGLVMRLAESRSR